MNGSSCWGIFRERAHSPGRESDDAEILRLTANHLEARGFQVELKDPDALGAPAGAWPPCVFLMCERPAVLRELRDRKSTRLNSSHIQKSRMPSSA